jgi:hypothetical protein
LLPLISKFFRYPFLISAKVIFQITAVDLKSDHVKIFCVSQTYLKKEQNADI